MFSGSWKESGQEVINIEVPDENITLDGMFKKKIKRYSFIFYPSEFNLNEFFSYFLGV